MSKQEKKDEYHVQVFARIRPFYNKKAAEKEYLKVEGKHIEVSLPNHGNKRYTFDHIFDMEATQYDIYQQAIRPIVAEVLKGYNCTVFAYGQTGSGKTHTMIGPGTGAAASAATNYSDQCNSGIIPRAFEEILESLKRQEADYTIRVSYLEIYNEVLNDLLSQDKKFLRIYEDPKNKSAVQIHGLKEVSVVDEADVYEILRIGCEKLKIAETLMNQHSSRSHAVFTITVHIKEATTAVTDVFLRTGKLNLVDLAGSENIQRSGATDKQAREAGNINQSLLTLGRVIKALVEKSAHVPFREAKLTRILQDSLGGKTKTTMIATVSPNICNLDQTLSTLDYACKARSIMINPEINEHLSRNILIRRYMDSINKLKKDLLAARTGEGFYIDEHNYNLLLQEYEKSQENALKAVAECSDFENRLGELTRIHSQLRNVFLVTKCELKDAKDKLVISRNELKRLRADRRISDELISKYDETQMQFLKHSKEMSLALDNHIKEHNILRAKMDCFHSAMERNEYATEYLGTEHSTLVLNVEESLGKLKTMITMSLEDVKKWSLHYIEQQSDVLNKMYKDSENTKLVIRKIRNSINNHYQNREEIFAAKIMLRLNLTENHAEMIRDFVKKENESRLSAFNQVMEILNFQQGIFQAQIEEYRAAINIYRDATEKTLQLWNDQVKSTGALFKEKMLQVNNYVKQMNVPVEAIGINMKELQQQVYAKFNETMRFEEMHENVIQSLTKETANLKESLPNEGIIYQDSLNKDLVDLSQKNNVIQNLMQMEVEQRDRTEPEVMQLLSQETVENLFQNIDNNRRELDEQISNECCEFTKLRNTGQENSECCSKEIKNAHVELTEGIKEFNSTVVHTMLSDIDVCKTHVEGSMIEFANTFPELNGVVKGFLKQCHNPKRAGDTPQRKHPVTFTIPKKITAKPKIFSNYENLPSVDEDSEDRRNSLDFYDLNDSDVALPGQSTQHSKGNMSEFE